MNITFPSPDDLVELQQHIVDLSKALNRSEKSTMELIRLAALLDIQQTISPESKPTEYFQWLAAHLGQESFKFDK